MINEENLLTEEIELLHKQFKILAEKSKDCSINELVILTEQMVKLHCVLNQSYY